MLLSLCGSLTALLRVVVLNNHRVESVTPQNPMVIENDHSIEVVILSSQRPERFASVFPDGRLEAPPDPSVAPF